MQDQAHLVDYGHGCSRYNFRSANDAVGRFISEWKICRRLVGKEGRQASNFTKRFDTDGSAMGPEDQSNSDSHGNTWAIQVDGNSLGKYVVVWRDDGDNGIRGRAYKADGTTVTASSFRAGPFKQGSTQTFSPSVAIKPNGSFIVVWKENAAGGVVGELFDANQVSQEKFIVTSKKLVKPTHHPLQSRRTDAFWFVGAMADIAVMKSLPGGLIPELILLHR